MSEGAQHQLPPVLILDGGLGTTLEDTFYRDISTPLWSARPIEHDPEVIIEAHLAFLKAGARIISTATYQSAYNTFERSGYTRADAIRIMRQAVALACIAKDRFLVERTEARREDVQVALSLGPYGATLNANEFDGMYPPPYGPGPSASRARNSFSPCEEELRECSIEALKGFHLDRLRVFAEDRETWDSIDWVAFETVPLTREITAIRRAMGALNSELPARRSDSRWRKQWWISGVHPFGVYPEQSPDGGSVTAGHVVRAILEQEGAGEANPVPDGIGINCTGVRYLSSIVGEMGEVVVHVGGEQRPWLVLYPNGREWDVGTQSWVAVGADEDEAAGAWATAFAEAIMPCMRHGHAWGGVVIGGCCKSGPRDIVALVKVVKRVWETVHR